MSFKSKSHQFAKKQLDSWAHTQGLNMADQTIKSVVKDVQSKLFPKNPNVDILPESNDETNLNAVSDIDITDIAIDSTTNNSLWLLEKSSEIVSTVREFVNGKISRADCIENLVTTTSGFVGKIVKGVTIVSVGVGNIITFGFLPISPEWAGHLTGAIASKLFCFAFEPLINHLRKNEARETYEYLHGFYEASINELRRQRELFESATAELFSHRQDLIKKCMTNLDSAFVVNDGDKISETLALLAQEFGGELKFKNFEEFDEWMLSDKELVI